MRKEELLDWLEIKFVDFCTLLKLRNPKFKWSKEDEQAYQQILTLIEKSDK